MRARQLRELALCRDVALSRRLVEKPDHLVPCVLVDECPAMRASLLIAVCRVLTWCCVFLLAVLSLMPAQDMVRTGVPGGLEHLVAYAGSAAFGMAGYGPSRGGVRVIGGFWVYAAVLEYLQQFSPGRHPSLVDFAASAFGALCGGLAVALLRRRFSDQQG
jgi:hypothetical protein